MSGIFASYKKARNQISNTMVYSAYSVYDQAGCVAFVHQTILQT
jgi:hypothetical protein